MMYDFLYISLSVLLSVHAISTEDSLSVYTVQRWISFKKEIHITKASSLERPPET